ncbi:MAG: DNA mismatch repair protein MutS, partial [Clostridia bacterium]|nr:DNA mismatch repair protein MutS [Clostridia bacterium]
MALSPMMQQYKKTKEKYADCLVFYRLGDFYEMFFEDAIVASKELDLTLTARDSGDGERAPMCGVPYHAAEGYLAKLVAKGYKVAVCEQLTDPKLKGLVERDVVRVVTAGTVVESSMLTEDVNNYIACIFVEDGKAALSYADVSTGDFCATEWSGKKAEAELESFLVKLSPAEIIVNHSAKERVNSYASFRYAVLPVANGYYDWSFDKGEAERALKNALQVRSLSSMLPPSKKAALQAAGALIAYVGETQKRALKHINAVRFVRTEEYMLLEGNTFRNLELTKTLREGKKRGSLLWLLDKTKTSAGARLLASMIEQPLIDAERIERRLNAVEELTKKLALRDTLREELSGIRDIERLVAKVCAGAAGARDLLAVKESLRVLPAIKELLAKADSALLTELSCRITPEPELYDELNRAIDEKAPQLTRDGGFILPGYCERLDELKEFSTNGERKLAELEAAEREATGIKTLKVGYNRVFGYYIEVSKSLTKDVPFHYVRKQTLANAERYITPELKELEERILSSNEKSVKLELELFAELIEKVKEKVTSLQQSARAIAAADVLGGFALLAVQQRYTKPKINPMGARTVIKAGRHPVVEAFSGDTFVSNDTFLDGEDQTLVITGPNMAGKSTYMRQVALITVMAHIGSFVPADSAEIALCDRIFTRIGASDNLLFDQSTFMVEMTEVAEILRNATANSLLILDEVGRGTGTFDGLSIAWAPMEYIAREIGAKTL